MRYVIADRAAKQPGLIFERIEDCPLRHGTHHVDAELAVDVCQRSQMRRNNPA